MSIQKIMSVSSRKLKTDAFRAKDSVASTPKAERNDTSLEKSEALKNSFLGGISFKGRPGSVSCTVYRTCGDITEEEILSEALENLDYNYTKDRVVIRGKKHVYPQSSKYTTNNVGVYYASSGETLTSKIFDDFSIIVVDQKDVNKPVVKIEEEKKPIPKYTGSDLPEDVPDAMIELAADSETLGGHVSKLSERNRKINSEYYETVERKKHVDHWTQVASNKYYDAQQELDLTDSDDYEAVQRAQHNVDVAGDEYSSMQEESEYVNDKIKTLETMRTESTEKLRAAEKKLEFVQEVELKYAMKLLLEKPKKPKGPFSFIKSIFGK